MNIESLREYSLSLPHTSEDMAFGEGFLLFRVCDKIFGCVSLEGTDYLAVKCDPDYALELRERYREIEPAYHWNKKYWNQIRIKDGLADSFIMSLIRHSYSEVVKKLPKSVKASCPEILDVKSCRELGM